MLGKANSGPHNRSKSGRGATEQSVPSVKESTNQEEKKQLANQHFWKGLKRLYSYEDQSNPDVLTESKRVKPAKL